MEPGPLLAIDLPLEILDRLDRVLEFGPQHDVVKRAARTCDPQQCSSGSFLSTRIEDSQLTMPPSMILILALGDHRHHVGGRVDVVHI